MLSSEQCMLRMYQRYSLQEISFIENFVRFHAIEAEIYLYRKFWKKSNLQYHMQSDFHKNLRDSNLCEGNIKFH